MLKNFMQIVGCEILNNDIMELTLIPLSTVKTKKPSLMDLASGGLDSILQTMEGNKQYKTKMYMPITTWGDMKLKIGSHVTVVLDCE